jgi:polysaccharide chain length determinant protein (PEP-CTERM system associated)
MKDFKALAFQFLDQLHRRKWIALGVVWIVCVFGWCVVAFMPDRYVSEARFHVDTTSLLTPLLKGISVNSDDNTRDQQVAIMQRTLTSRPNLLKVAQMTDLDKGASSDAALQDLVTSLEGRISIRSQGTNLFQVQFTDNSPTIARNVVQALLTLFVESSIGDKRNDIRSARTFIDTQIEEYEVKLKAAERKVADFKVENVQYLSSNSQTFAARMEAAQDNLKSARFEYDDAMSLVSQMRQQLNATPRYLSINAAPQVIVGGGYVGGSLQQRIMATQARLDELRLQFTEKHPDVIAAQKALDRMMADQNRDGGNSSTSSDPMRAQVPNELYSQLSLRLAEAEGRSTTARRKLAEAESIFQSLEARANEAPIIEAEFTNLNRDYEVFRASYDTLLQRRESARIAAAADSTAEPIQFRMVAAPELPARPSGPHRELLNVAVFIAGLMAAAGFIILLTKIDDRVSAVGDLDDFGDVRTLGSVSAVAQEPFRLIFNRKLDNFGWAAAGLVILFGLVLFIQPNFSMLAKSIL